MVSSETAYAPPDVFTAELADQVESLREQLSQLRARLDQSSAASTASLSPVGDGEWDLAELVEWVETVVLAL